MRTLVFLLLVMPVSLWFNSLGIDASLLDISYQYTDNETRFSFEANLFPIILSAIIAYFPYRLIYEGVGNKLSKLKNEN